MTLPGPLDELVVRWREDAERLRAYGHEATAQACDRHADQLEQAWCNWYLEGLTVSEAAEESGYSESRLYDLVAEGAVPNAGRPGAPRIRRCDVPRRPRGRPEGGETLLQRVGLDDPA